jgi:hypothetical protein
LEAAFFFLKKYENLLKNSGAGLSKGLLFDEIKE